MSLINDQLKDKAQVSKPKPVTIKLPKLQPEPLPAEVTSAAPLSEVLPEEAGAPEPLPTAEEIVRGQAPVPNIGLPELAKPTAVTNQLPTIAPLPPIFQDLSTEYPGAAYNPAAINTRLPTVYNSAPPTTAGVDMANFRARYNINRYNEAAREEAERLAAANRAAEVTERRDTLPNVPRVDKPWYSGIQKFGNEYLNALGEFAFGSTESQAAADKGDFNPIAGRFGRKGAGLGGLLVTIGSTAGDVVLGGAAEANKLTANTLERLGVSRGAAENFARNGFLSLLPDRFNLPGQQSRAILTDGKPVTLEGSNLNLLKPSNVIGFNWNEARKRNSVVDAITGDQVGSFNNPKNATEVDTGRVFYSPRRQPGSRWQTDPLGAGLQIVWNVFNPFDAKVADLASDGVRAIYRRTLPVPKVNAEFVEPPLIPTSRQITGREQARLGFGVVKQPELPPARSPIPEPIVTPQTRRAGRQQPLPSEDRVLQPQIRAEFVDDEIAVSGQRGGFIRDTQTGVFRSPGGELVQNPGYIEPINLQQRTIRNPVPPSSGQTLVTPKPPSNLSTQSAKNVVYPELLEDTPAQGFRPGFIRDPETGVFRSPGGELAPSNSPQAASFPNATIVRELPGSGQTIVTPKPPSNLSTEVYTGQIVAPKQQPRLITLSNDDVITVQPERGTTLVTPPNTLSTEVQELRITRRANIPSAANPVRVLSIAKDGVSVTQRLLPPSVDYRLLPPAKDIRPIAGKSYLQLALEIGAGTPSLKPVVSPILSVRSHSEVVQALQEASPKLLSGYTGATFEQLKQHLFTKKVAIDSISSVGAPPVTPENFATRINALSSQAAIEKRKLIEAAKPGVTFPQLQSALAQIDRKLRTDQAYLRQQIELYPRLQPANLEPANLEPANLEPANLEPANLEPANLERPSLTLDDLSTAAEELAAQKAAIEAPLKQLDELLATTEDFGRRTQDRLALAVETPERVLSVYINGGKPNILPAAFDVLPDNYKRLLQNADFEQYVEQAVKSGDNPNTLVAEVVERHNQLLAEQVPIANVSPTKGVLQLSKTKLPTTLYHGTAVDKWSPDYNLSLFGSRGELGSGLYLTTDLPTATLYSQALISENANPEINSLGIQPSVRKLFVTFKATLDGRARFKSDESLFDELAVGLPETLVSNTRKAIRKNKTVTYVQFLDKLENNLKRSSIELSEATLQELQTVVSNNLRRLGYDSVADLKFGNVLALDGSRIKPATRLPVEAPANPLQATLARYNVDAAASKAYPYRLSSDANLRDSAYKSLSQIQSDLDIKLSEVQQEYIRRDANTEETLLPAYDAEPRKLPKSALDIVDEIDGLIDNICTP